MIDKQIIAKVCHEVNRAYCKSLGDDSQPPWESAPQWQRDSAVNGVIFHLGNANLGGLAPQASHENWMKEKIAAGWKYGKVKDPDKKEHPCLIPYEELPKEQQAKDALFVAVVDSLAPYEV